MIRKYDGLIADNYEPFLPSTQPQPIVLKPINHVKADQNEAFAHCYLLQVKLPTIADKIIFAFWEDNQNIHIRRPLINETFIFLEKHAYSRFKYRYICQVLAEAWDPGSFFFKGAIRTNWICEGLLHSFLRHSNEWLRVIPNLWVALRRMPWLEPYLNNIGLATNEETARQLLFDFKHHQWFRIQNSKWKRKAFGQVMTAIHDYLYHNINRLNYAGEGVNEAGGVQVFFKVLDLYGQELYMTVCPSTELHDPPEIAGRKFRRVVTVFFINKDVYKTRFSHEIYSYRTEGD